MTPQQLFIMAAMSCLNIPYIWGGNNPLQGLDCGGLTQHILQSAGVDPPGDQSSQAQFNHFSMSPFGKIIHDHEVGAGALLFYGRDVAQITHVAMALNDTMLIEAGGGGRRTKTAAQAAKQGAFVRLRMIGHRQDRVSTVLPAYIWGMCSH